MMALATGADRGGPHENFLKLGAEFTKKIVHAREATDAGGWK
jgi:hypothetical protein